MSRKQYRENIKDSKKKRIFQIGLQLFFAVLFAVFLEVIFNFRELAQGYDYQALSPQLNIENGQLIISRTLEEPVYIKKLLLEGSFQKNPYYTIHLSTINEFGVEEIIELEDRANSIFEQAFTNIGYTVKSIEIIFEDQSLLQIDGVSISNQATFSNYRMFFFALIFFSLILIFTERKLLLKHLEWLYGGMALGFGILLISISGPQAVTWDEEAHFTNAYVSSLAKNDTRDLAAESNFSRAAVTVNTGEERILLERYMNTLSESSREENISWNIQAGVRQRLIYFPMSVLMWLARCLHLPFSVQYAAGRMGNLLFCILLNMTAIRLLQKKVLLTVIALLPTLIFQSCMITYDGVIFASLTLGVVFCLYMRQHENMKRKKSLCLFFSALFLFLWASLAKPVYLPAALFLLFPLKNIIGRCPEKQKKRIKKFTLAIAVMMVLAAAGFAVWLILGIAGGNLLVASDLRGGTSDVAAQLTSILQHPLSFLKMLLGEILTMDNFRNFGDPSLNRYLVSNLMFLNLYVLGTLKDAWSLILLPLLAMVFLASPEKREIPANIKAVRITALLTVLGSALLIWLSMYLFFTPVGSSGIEGVQARYFLPLALPFACLVQNRRICLKISELCYRQIALTMTLLLTAVCVYQGAIAGRVL